MSISHLLETFDAAKITGPFSASEEDAAVDMELEVFERGYKAGWDDSQNSQSKALAALQDDLAQNLRDLSFTYHEAYNAVLKSLQPVVSALMEQIAPELAQHGLARRVAGEVAKAAGETAGNTLTICCNPKLEASLAPLLPEDTGLDLRLIPEPQLAAGQVMLRFSEREIEFDIDAFTNDIITLTRDFFSQLAEDNSHG